ncbi:hypothetical protein 16Q_125 [Pseudomonas phage 16Q]|nr:hypothetical protein 16Q_125 [Pseudomonas phage 16Q]
MKHKQFKRGDVVKRVTGSFLGTQQGGIYRVRDHDGLLYLDSMDDGRQLEGSYDENMFILAAPESIEIEAGIQISLDEAVHKCKGIKKQIEVLEKELKTYTQVMTNHGVKFI